MELEAELREFYLETDWGKSYFTFGKQQVVGVRPMDSRTGCSQSPILPGTYLRNFFRQNWGQGDLIEV